MNSQLNGQLSSEALTALVEQCAAKAANDVPGDPDLRARCFIARLSVCLIKSCPDASRAMDKLIGIDKLLGQHQAAMSAGNAA